MDIRGAGGEPVHGTAGKATGPAEEETPSARAGATRPRRGSCPAGFPSPCSPGRAVESFGQEHGPGLRAGTEPQRRLESSAVVIG